MKLQNYINPAICTTIEENSSSLEIKETEQNTKLKSITITDIPKHTVFFAFDQRQENNKQLRNQYLNPETKLIHKHCDGVFLWEEADGISLLLVELKSESPSPGDYERQLINSSNLVEYMSEIFRSFEEEKDVLEIKKCSYVLFYLNTILAPKGIRPANTTLEHRIHIQAPAPMKLFQHKNIIKAVCVKPLHNFVSWLDIIEKTN